MPRWPDFFIVGAGRAGTTSLYYHLRNHPDIFMPSVKEPHFFSRFEVEWPILRGYKGTTRSAGVITDEPQYLKLFEDAAQHQVLGEASTTYIADITSPQRIKEKNPNARIVAILRNPIERAHSQYLLDLREGRESDPSFYEALKTDHEFMLRHGDVASSYIWHGFYSKHLQLYLDTFGQDHVKVYLYEDMDEDSSNVVQDICKFLGINWNDGDFFDPDRRYHAYSKPRNKLFGWISRQWWLRSVGARIAPMHLLILIRDRMVDRRYPKPDMDNRAQDFLVSLYKEDILKLQTMIERDLSHWLG